ncbi:MAG: ester cyclase [Pseudomonadota bacterium]
MSDIAEAKALVRAFWEAVDTAPAGSLAKVAAQHLDAKFHWQGFAPLPQTRGPEEFAEVFLEPFRAAFPSYERQTHIFMAGVSNGRKDGQGDGALWVGATGYLTGRAAQDAFGIPAGTTDLRLRWSDFFRIEDGRIVQCQQLIDVIDWFEQIGRPVLPKPRGVAHVWPAPTGVEGCYWDAQDAGIGAATLELGRRFIFDGLNAFDENDLGSMGMDQFFHPNIKWYGPGGIGACFSHAEFTSLHQQPWLVAFPDREVQDLDNLFAESNMVAGSSFPGVIGHQTGPYQGVAATGAQVAFKGIDFWLRRGDQFVENWVFVDFIDMFAQMGVDLMERMKNAG